MRKLLSALALRSIAAKLVAMAAAGLLFMVLVAVTMLVIARGELITERVEKAHAIVDATWSIAENFQQLAAKGAITTQEAKARFFAAAGGIWFEGHTNYVFIYDTQTGLCLMNTGNPKLLGKDVHTLRDANGLPFADKMLDIATRQGEGTVRYAFPRGGSVEPFEKIAYIRGFGPWNLMIASAEYMTDIDATFWRMARTAATMIGVLLACLLMIAWAIGRGILKPLSALKARMAALSNGELDAPVAGARRRDEVGEMARSVQVFKDHMVSERNRALEQEAERGQAEAAKRAALRQMADTIEVQTGTALRQIAERTSAMAATADTMSASAARTGPDGRRRGRTTRRLDPMGSAAR